MKKLKLIGFLIIMASSLMFIGCTTDVVTGPAGADGLDGTAGTDGTDGTNGTDGLGIASCIDCHSETHREPIETAYTLSKHSIETKAVWAGNIPISQYANQSSCSQCHTSDGFIDYINTGKVSDDPYPGLDQKINCNTCHGNHTSFDFETDGNDFALRTFAAVTLITDDSYVIDLGDKSNTCVNCHQPRTSPPTDEDDDGMFTVYSHWGPHHGPQSTFLEGIQGAEIAGSIDYLGPQSATHRTGSSCTSCHMGTTTNGSDGSHSFWPTQNACTTCHATVPTEVAGLADDIETLAVLLADIGIVVDGSEVPGPFTIKQAEAAWNYLLIMEDKSHGVHNPAYARALVTNSIEALQ